MKTVVSPTARVLLSQQFFALGSTMHVVLLDRSSVLIMQLSDLRELSLVTILTCAALFLLTVIYVLRKNRGVFPGPIGLPYLGLLPFLKYDTCHLQLEKYGKKYGDIYSFTYSGRLFIHLGSVKAVRDLHINKSECFVDRVSTFNALSYMIPDGVVMSNGEMWRIQRKFFIQKFREYGLHSIQEGPIYESLDETLKILRESSDGPINIFQILTERCTGTLSRIIFGENGISDDDIATLNAAYAASLEGMFGTGLMIMGPVGRFLFSISSTARKAMKAHRETQRILSVCIKKIESKMNEEQPTCIIEEYFKERNEKRRQNDPTWKFYTDTSLVSSLVQIVGDGIGGVASFIVGVLNALIEHPEEQEKIYEEIMDVVGASRNLTLGDKASLPYTNAFFNEALRTSNFISLFPSQECTKETTYRGYRIPKGAITLYNFWAIHHNPDTFEDPDTFNPSRYLPGPGKTKPELPTTFGMGKRSCSGEAFVMAQTFLFVTTIIRNFKVVASSDPKNSFADFILTGKLELWLQPRVEEKKNS